MKKSKMLDIDLGSIELSLELFFINLYLILKLILKNFFFDDDIYIHHHQ